MDRDDIRTLNLMLDMAKSVDRRMSGKHYVYAFKCIDNTVYVGKTNSPVRRMIEHIQGKTSNIRSIYPVELIYLQEFSDSKEGSKAELSMMKLLNPEQYDNTVGKGKRSRYSRIDKWKQSTGR